MKPIVVVLVIGLLAACGNPEEQTGEPDLLNQAVEYMTGSYNSAAQAGRDTNYFNIALQMYPIWQTKDFPGAWLYVEQALAEMPDKPYRQRIYHLQQPNDSVVTSTIYELPNPNEWVGAWQTPEVFDGLLLDSLIAREGCMVYLQKTGEKLVGGTQGRLCLSSLRGASYATTEVTVYADSPISWDRGYNEAGEQVWGAETGGYVFVKQ